MNTPKDRGETGLGWICPYCCEPKDEGQQTGVYYYGKPVCGPCAAMLSERRRQEDIERNRGENLTESLANVIDQAGWAVAQCKDHGRRLERLESRLEAMATSLENYLKKL